MAGSAQSAKDKSMASYLKEKGVCRTTARCGMCYAIVAIDSVKSKYTHLCWTSRKSK